MVFALPFLLTASYLSDVFNDPLRTVGLPSAVIETIRLGGVLGYCGLKAVHMRMELQLYFDQTVAYF